MFSPYNLWRFKRIARIFVQIVLVHQAPLPVRYVVNLHTIQQEYKQKSRAPSTKIEC